MDSGRGSSHSGIAPRDSAAPRPFGARKAKSDTSRAHHSTICAPAARKICSASSGAEVQHVWLRAKYLGG